MTKIEKIYLKGDSLSDYNRKRNSLLRKLTLAQAGKQGYRKNQKLPECFLLSG